MHTIQDNIQNDNKVIRNGYGSQFNDLFIIDTIIIKKSKTTYGNFKIAKEITFLKYLIENNITFPIPKMLEYGELYYKMIYLHEYIPLYRHFMIATPDEKNNILRKIYNSLHILHSSSYISLNLDKFRDLLISETYTKLQSRYIEIEHIILKYNFIDSVNGIKLKKFSDILLLIQKYINEYVASLNEYIVRPIHGDCQFNNILYSPKSGDIIFIDPRGYFGDLDIYGIPEYDMAKIKFALSGYDIFDNMVVDSLEINSSNINLPSIALTNIDELFSNKDIISILTITIWLGNAHCFKDNIPKMAFSFYYAMYLATLYL